jgi:Tfp pilus assembly protein PilO
MNRNLIGIIAIVLAVILGFFLLRPKITSVRDVSIQKEVSLRRVKLKESRLEALRTLSGIFSTQAQDVDALLRALPTEPEIPDVLVTIESMTRESGLSLETIAPSVDKTKQVVSLSLDGKADMAALERFFQAVADNRRPISISQVTMTKDQSSNALNYNFIVSFAYIPEVAQADTPAAETGTTGTNGTSGVE